jgi:hypothetical protein
VTSNSANTESTAAAITGAKSTDEFPDGRACFREFMSDVNFFAVMFNLRAEIIYCNGHFILMTGLAVDEVMGRGWSEIFASPGMGTKAQAEPEMHFLPSLTVIFGFTVVVGLAFVKVICDLLGISVHASPDMSPQPEAGRAQK